MNKYEERLNRVLSAVALEPVDRIPFIASGSASNAAVTGLKLSTYCTDMVANCDANLNAMEIIGEPDGVQATCFNPDILASAWLSAVKIPGRDLSENELWQIEEKELMLQEDYDTILAMGFGPWYMQFLVEKLDDPIAKCASLFEYTPTSIQRFAQAGYPLFTGGILYAPFDMLCGGRSLQNFLVDDIYDIPDKVEEVMDLAQAFNIEVFKQTLYNPQYKPHAVWIGGWRGTPSMLNQEMFERFSWKYMKELAELVIEAGVVPMFHLDSDWTRGLSYFRELPKGKCILALDGKTDIFNAKKVIGDHCCLMGDVSATMLAFGTVDEVKTYCNRLKKEVGPIGFILSSGCDAPFNAKLENLQAMAHSVFED